MVPEYEDDDPEGRTDSEYHILHPYPRIAVANNFIMGHWACRGKDEGRYPYGYMQLIDRIFGPEKNTIEVCSRTVQVDDKFTAFTVDLNPKYLPSLVTDAETLAGVPSRKFKRARSDKPYNTDTAQSMYGFAREPDTYQMLKAMARVVDIGSLIVMLLGPSGNFRRCKDLGLKRIAYITVSVVPSNEGRCINVYYKHSHPEILEEGGYGKMDPEMVERKYATAGRQGTLI